MDYQNRRHASVEAGLATRRIRDTLTGLGFRVVREEANSIELSGPGMISSGQNSLVGASKVTIITIGREVTIEAEFGGVRRLIGGICVLILGLAVFFFVLFGFVIPVEKPAMRFILPLCPLAPWPILLPWMTWLFKRRTARAFDGLLESVA